MKPMKLDIQKFATPEVEPSSKTYFNNTQLTSVFYNNNELDKMYYNNVLVFEKYVAPTVYKRRIMVGDNLKGKIIYSDFPSDWLNNMNTRMSNMETITYVHVNDSVNESIYEMTMPDNGTSYYQKCVPVENYNSNFGNIYYCEGSDVNSCIQNPQLKYLSDKDYLVQTIISDNPSYRHCYIEDSNIRPIQEGDVITENTKIYFTWPDNLNPTNGAGQTDAIINFNFVFKIVYKYKNFNKKFNIESVSWLSSEEKVVLFDQELDINKSYLDLNEFVEGATISGTISFEGGTLPIEVLNGFLVDTTTLG